MWRHFHQRSSKSQRHYWGCKNQFKVKGRQSWIISILVKFKSIQETILLSRRDISFKIYKFFAPPRKQNKSLKSGAKMVDTNATSIVYIDQSDWRTWSIQQLSINDPRPSFFPRHSGERLGSTAKWFSFKKAQNIKRG